MSQLFFIIILFLLLLSILNNYFIYNQKYPIPINSTYLINTNDLPNNIKFKTYTFFYNKNNIYDKCHIDDFKTINNNTKRPYMEIILKDHIDFLNKTYPSKYYILENNNNDNIINIADYQIELLGKIL